MIQESVKAAIRAERERVQNEANRGEGPNVAPVARECTFADFMKKTWAEMKVMMTEEFCPPEEIQKMEGWCPQNKRRLRLIYVDCRKTSKEKLPRLNQQP
uniref:Reverse transcriptase domain-containing protein n=1 Tax=Tanacetum cinerariifolium TaxID=118510 RepID=A0A699U0X5_TANCI|nr:hypothetical protein [Tanacetum cinerariifolium]